MKFTEILKMDHLKVFVLLCFGAIKVSASPLYQDEKFPQASAKVVLPEALEAVESLALPLIHNNDFDMIMPDYFDSHSEASMLYQNFQEFFDPDSVNDGEYNMDETQFVHTNPVRAPQPLSQEERRIRHKLEDVDEKREKKQQLKLRKGSFKPRYDAAQWDQFDYDAYSVDPAKKHKKPYYH